MRQERADIVIIGGGGAGLRAAIAAAEADPSLDIALVSKVYPMRSHTVAAEGGCAGVVQDHDSIDHHFDDTVSGGDWLCDQDVVEYFVRHATEENLRLEHWGCPWSRKPDGRVNVRAFGGMKIERTWFAADKTGSSVTFADGAGCGRATINLPVFGGPLLPNGCAAVGMPISQ